MTWYQSLAGIRSLGSQAERPGSLAGLHEAREQHLSQFFTPSALAGLLWRIATPAMDTALKEHEGSKIAILDNSVGSGRLLQFAESEKHVIGAVDLHGDSIAKLSTVLDAAGFECTVLDCGMEEVHPRNYGVALINPPFSIHLETPNLKPYQCTTWGRFGPNTSSTSHEYALHQALDAADIVLAILPRTYAMQLKNEEGLSDRLRGLIHLPAGAFRDEGTEVSTSVAVFGPAARKPSFQELRMSSLDAALPDFELRCGTTRYYKPELREIGGFEDEGPSITLPVSGDRSVRVAHDGRRVVLGFNCGLTKARVMNAIYGDHVGNWAPEGHRHPKGVKFTGQGKLDLEVHLAQADPMDSFREFLSEIEQAGGVPVVHMGLMRYLRRKIKENAKKRVPFRHVVRMPFSGGSKLTAKARVTHVAVAGIWGSPAIRMGQEIEFEQKGEKYSYQLAGQTFEISKDELYKRFEVTAQGNAGDQWVTVYEGRNHAFPEQAASLRAKAVSLGIDQWLSWGFQLDDLVELMIAPGDAILAYQMGLGKARMAISLVAMSQCKHGLIAVEAHLVDEMVAELKLLGVAEDRWQVIRNPSDLDSLRQINVISYERLRSPISQAHQRRTYASRLRRRIGVMVADEGHLMRKPDTDQTRALWMVSAKRRYLLTGTPAANYPRDVHQLLVFEGGDGTAVQPYGNRRSFMEPALRHSMAYAVRGVDAFRDRFIVTEWVTNEFKEDNTNGAKREVPKIANLDEYRRALACHVKRRVDAEPEVAKYIRIPVPTKTVTTIRWDKGHLAYYLGVAEDFAAWYRDTAAKAGKRGISVNLIALLARIQAVEFACNLPQRPRDGFGSYAPITSKQAYALDRIEQLVEEGRKIILYAENPEVLDRLHAALSERGIDSLVFTGKQSIKKRTRELDMRFRYGACPVLLASLGVTQTGLNIPQANFVLFYNRAWDSTTEKQAGARVLRPQQVNEVDFEYLHLEGSIDEYMAQMVDMKADAIDAGLDWASPQLSSVEFLHLDTMLGRFCEDLAKRFGVERGELREALAA